MPLTCVQARRAARPTRCTLRVMKKPRAQWRKRSSLGCRGRRWEGSAGVSPARLRAKRAGFVSGPGFSRAEGAELRFGAVAPEDEYGERRIGRQRVEARARPVSRAAR